MLLLKADVHIEPESRTKPAQKNLSALLQTVFIVFNGIWIVVCAKQHI